MINHVVDVPVGMCKRRVWVFTLECKVEQINVFSILYFYWSDSAGAVD